MPVNMYEWVNKEFNTLSTEGDHISSLTCHVSGMVVGMVYVRKRNALSVSKVTAVMVGRPSEIFNAELSRKKGKEWVETEFAKWFMAVNRLAHAYLDESKSMEG